MFGPVALTLAFLRRDWRVARSYRVGLASDLVHSVIGLFFLYFLSRLVSSRDLQVGGALTHGYFPFVVTGIVLLGIVTSALGAVSERLRTDQTTGTLEAMLAMPSPPWLTVLGSASYQLAYATASALVTVVIAVAGFGLRFHAQPMGVLVAVAGVTLTIAFFCGLGVAFAGFVVVFKRGNRPVLLLGTLFSLLGGVYYPVGLLPTPLRLVSDVLPFTWAVDLVRKSLLEAQVPWVELVWLLLASLALVPLSLWVFTAAVAHCRRRGTLGQY
jgi:ABC-2 type transport system permease protein